VTRVVTFHLGRRSAAPRRCRAAAGLCDAAEACDGSSNACPVDAKLGVAAGRRRSRSAFLRSMS
jgi:hypothetical protein